MSLELPPRPNLEHLKKQAKDRLGELQRQTPSAQLADAQHVLAREYGFASWPKLKAHVESTAAAPPPAPVHPLAGAWVIDVRRSQPHPDNPVRQATIAIAVDGDVVTIADVVLDIGGREERHTNVVYADGSAREVGHGYRMTAGWQGHHVLDVAVTKDEMPAGWARYEVSGDGQTLTIAGEQQIAIFDRRA
jgi:hypothetical protein